MAEETNHETYTDQINDIHDKLTGRINLLSNQLCQFFNYDIGRVDETKEELEDLDRRFQFFAQLNTHKRQRLERKTTILTLAVGLQAAAITYLCISNLNKKGRY